MDANEYRLGYRSDIEGLRAVAILLVVAGHAGVPWLSGGFVGVDVFFVLSGFLITGLLAREFADTGRLCFADFYVRRLRRLLPALLVMLLITTGLATQLLAPSAQREQAIAAATASVWLSNVHFAFARLDYFAAGSDSNLFLHTWSLGVEEQFYLIWPALLVGLLRAGGSTTKLKVVLLMIVAASLLACVALTYAAPQMAFYLMPLRAWQFAVGGLVWLYFRRASGTAVLPGYDGRWSRATSWVGWIGLAVIFIAGVTYSADMPYPGLSALWPTVGAAAVIAAGVHGSRGGVARALSWRPLQGIGRISYSWYLWHWPVLLFGEALFASAGAAYRAALVALSLIPALLSYRYVEKPTRHQRLWLAHPKMAMVVSLGIMMTANVLCIRWFNQVTDWLNQPEQQRYARAHADAPVIYSMGCDDWYHSDAVRICAFGAPDATHTAVLMGDSIAGQWFPAAARLFTKPGWRLLVVTKSSCPMVDEPFFYERIRREYTECSTWRTHALEQIARIKPDRLLLGTVSTDNFTREQWINGTVRVLRSVSGAAGHVYILRGTPYLPFDGPDCLASQQGRPSWLSRENACNAIIADKHADDVYRWLHEASSQFDNVTTIDLHDDICPKGICSAEQHGMIVFRDSQHMTATFAASLSESLGRQLGAN